MYHPFTAIVYHPFTATMYRPHQQPQAIILSSKRNKRLTPSATDSLIGYLNFHLLFQPLPATSAETVALNDQNFGMVGQTIQASSGQ